MASTDPLDHLPKIHPRERLVTEAEQQLRTAIIGLNKIGLTTGEFLQVITNVMSGEISSIAKYAIRNERHGNLDKPGGWA
jgi:hypothetical protein